MDKMVEIARFTYPAEAQTLRCLLESEGIQCYLKDELSSQILGSYVDIGGVKVEILEEDLPHALEVMKEGGYPIETEDEPEQLKAISSFSERIPFLKKFPLEKQIMIIFIITAVLLALLIYFGSIVS